MNPRELILLSPYRLPAQNASMLANDDAGAFLHAYTASWHPAALLGATGPPKIGSPYDYEQPTAGHLYAVPETPPLILPDDWDERVQRAGAIAFRATADRHATLADLRKAILAWKPDAPTPAESAETERERVQPFFGIGFGYLMVEGLFEAMEHENLLSTQDLWIDVQAAVAAFFENDDEGVNRHLRAVAERLLAAREVVYPAAIHLLDVVLLEKRPLPASFDLGMPVNVVAPASAIEKLLEEQPERGAILRERLATESLELCGGPYRERDDALLPVESQLWNLRKGMATYREMLDHEPRVFARRRFAAHPQLPLLLQSVGLTRALLLAFDDAVLPSYRSTVVNWPSPDGKQVEAFTRTPYAADNPQTFLHVAHYLHRTIMQDHGATFALLHATAQAAPWYLDWLELSRFAPVLGQWTTFSRYFNDVSAGEYVSAASPDEFHGDYLSERTTAHSPTPVSGFARYVRQRRQLDTAWTLIALHRSLGSAAEARPLDGRLTEIEERVESNGEGIELARSLDEVVQEAAEALAQRLTARATANTPGYLLLNPCSFTRRAALELDDLDGPIPIGGPVKASAFRDGKGRLVVEVPGLGFAWLPRSGPPGTPPPATRMRLADEHSVRNEFFEATIDPATGGLVSIRDHRSRTNRLSQQIVYNPGSTMRRRGVTVVRAGPALGEVVSEGVLIDEQGEELAAFRQRFRAWLGRPILEMRVEITPRHAPAGYPWHAYYGCRFAWRDERAHLLRGLNGTAYVTTHTRPETPDFLEIRQGRESTAIFPCGLPFHQRHGGRMIDVILLPEGETARAFDLGIGLNREYPMQTALGLTTPIPLVRTATGPPQVGASGWLFHLDAPNLLLTNMRPAGDGVDSLVARFLECSGHGGPAELRCVRNPRRAMLLDARGTVLLEATTHDDAATFEAGQNDLIHLRVDFTS
jgi:alpha-mannosidase